MDPDAAPFITHPDGSITVASLPCPRCELVHSDFHFKKLTRPSPEWSHYALCPIVWEPIMIKPTVFDLQPGGIPTSTAYIVDAGE